MVYFLGDGLIDHFLDSINTRKLTVKLDDCTVIQILRKQYKMDKTKYRVLVVFTIQNTNVSYPISSEYSRG